MITYREVTQLVNDYKKSKVGGCLCKIADL